MTVSPVSAPARPRAGTPLALLTFGALLLVPIAASFLLYWKAIAVDGGWLAAADDRAMLDHARQDPSLRGLLALHGLHFVPAMRLTFLVMWALFGTAWTPYGVVLVLSHGLLGAAVAVTVYWFGRSWPVALGIALPLTVSWSLSSGVLTSFVYAPIYLLMCLTVLVPVLVDWYLSTSSKTALALLFLALSWCIFTLLSGLLAYIAAALFYAGLKYAHDDAGGGMWARLRGVFTVTRRDLGVLGVAVASLGLYGLAYGSELYAVGGKLPIEMGFCEETVHLSPLDRYLYVLAFGYFGFVARGGFGFLPVDEIGWTRFWYLGATAGLLAASIAGVFFPRKLPPGLRTTAVVVGGFVLLAVIAAGMVTSGRSCIQLWHMRYNAYALIFVGCAIGVLIGQIVKASPRPVSMVMSAALLALSLFVTYQNVLVVLASPWMVDRTPGFMGS